MKLVNYWDKEKSFEVLMFHINSYCTICTANFNQKFYFFFFKLWTDLDDL